MGISFSKDSFGNIKSETFDSGTVSSSIAWNPITKVMTETITLPSGKNIVETTLKGLPKTLEYDGSKLLQYNYGTGNVLTGIRKNFDLQDNHSAELSYTYNNWRKVSRRTEEFTAQNAPTVADYEYTYSKGLHLIGKQENEENRRTAYQYDSYYRLRRVDYNCAYNADDPTCIENRNNVFKCNTAESGCEDFQLDGVHNIRLSYENQTGFSWAVDGFNRLTQKSDGSNTVKYTYDSNNNMTGEDLDGDQNADIVYTYDKLNRLTSVANSDYLVEYSYDPFNRRTEKTVYYADGNDTYEQTHKYAYNDWDIISEEIKTVRTSDTPDTVTSWQLRRYVDQGTDNHIIMDTVSCSDDGNGNCSPNESTLQRIWFHKDERGNIIAISDGNGTIYERYRYRVYGEHEVLNADFTPKSTAAVSPFLWGGSLYEPETGLYWMRNRYYHIDMHRFINQDPIGIWGDANNLGNGFAYVAGMVIEASDPSGLDVEVIFWDPVGYGKSAFGHVSVRIDDISYSWGENGMDVSSAQNYALTNIFRDGEGFILSISENDEKELAQYLNNYAKENGKWTPINNCTQPIQSWLNEKYGKDLSSYFPSSLKTDLTDSGMVEKQSTKYEKGNKIASGSIKLEDGTTLQYEQYKTAQGLMVVKYSDGTTVLMDKYGNKIILREGEKVEELKAEDLAYPTPDGSNPSDTIQNVMMLNILAKMLKRGESEQPPFFTDTSTGPNGVIMIFRNPYYVNKDPLKTILFDGGNGSGRPMIYRNPFVPGAEYGYDSTTYEKWQQSGFIQPEVDPWE